MEMTGRIVLPKKLRVLNSNLPLYLDYGLINMSELEGSENKNKIKSKVNWNTRRQIKSSLAMTIHAISDNVIYHQ